jgi:putative peptidoglycan lipid II flippase
VPADTVAITRTLQGVVGGLVFFSSFQLLTRSFYATQNSRTPALVNVVAAVVNVGAALLYVGLGLGLRGTALAHATSYAVAATILFWRLRHRLGPLDGRRIARTVARLAVASAASAGAAWVVTELWTLPADASVLLEAAQVATAIVAGVLVFLGAALILRVGEVDDLRRALLGRLRG